MGWIHGTKLGCRHYYCSPSVLRRTNLCCRTCDHSSSCVLRHANLCCGTCDHSGCPCILCSPSDHSSCTSSVVRCSPSLLWSSSELWLQYIRCHPDGCSKRWRCNRGRCRPQLGRHPRCVGGSSSLSELATFELFALV